MKPITIEEAERLINEGKDVLNIDRGSIKHMDHQKLIFLKTLLQTPLSEKTQTYFYTPDDTKYLYTIIWSYYDTNDDRYYYVDNDINFSYYETYNNMRNIFKNIVDKFLMDKFNLSLSDLNCKIVNKYNNIQYTNKEINVYLSLDELSCSIISESEEYYIHTTISQLKK